MPNLDWQEFVRATKNRRPIVFVREAVDRINPQRGLALDLGCGAGIDAKYLAQQGFKVEAIDSSEHSVKQAIRACRDLPVKVIQKDIIDHEIKPDSYKMIIAWNTLPFLEKKQTKIILLDIQKGLKKNGFLVFAVFGPEDDWAKIYPKMSFWTIKELQKLLPGMDFIKVLEEKEKRKGATGKMKFWHQIKIMAKK